MSLTDTRHRATCDWNLYPDQRPDPELCNLDCLNRPDEVRAAWRLLGTAEGPCPRCGGTGQEGDELCDLCAGSGLVTFIQGTQNPRHIEC